MPMSYTTLTGSASTEGSIRRWLNKDVDAATVLEEAQTWIYRFLRDRHMIEVEEASMTVGQDTADLPDRFIAPLGIWYSGLWQGRLPIRDIPDVEAARAYDSDGALQSNQPWMACVRGTKLQFPCKADQAYTYRFVHYAQPELLASGTNETNFLTERCPRLVRVACLAFANDYWKNYEVRDGYLQEAMAEIERLNAESEDARLRTAQIQMEVA